MIENWPRLFELNEEKQISSGIWIIINDEERIVPNIVYSKIGNISCCM